nr:PfkB family carbohydrate kinase [Mesorhizobium sp. IRAMC:0171]
MQRDRFGVTALLNDIELDLVHTDQPVTFDYVHTLGVPLITPSPAVLRRRESLSVSNDVVFRYGMIEGDAVVEAQTAIYDPQSAFDARPFRENGSSATRLAIVLNRLEMETITGTSHPDQGARWLFENDQAELVVLKMGAKGALVMSRSGQTKIPLFASETVWKLGSGDVFSATFATLWGVHGMSAEIAADFASKATAWYCNSRALPPPNVEGLKNSAPIPITSGRGCIYLAGPFFDLGQRWLIEEARLSLRDAGADVFSPVHEIGPGDAHVVAPADLEGLEKCSVVLAILNGMDPGTVFEAGYAIKKGIPLVVLAENEKPEDLKMFIGSGAIVTADFVTAIYKAIWALPK